MTSPSSTQDSAASGKLSSHPWGLIVLRAIVPSSILGWLVSLTCLGIPILLLHATQIGKRFRAELPQLDSFDSLLALLNHWTLYLLPLGIVLFVRWWYYYALADLNHSLTRKLSTHDTLACWAIAFLLLLLGLTYPVRRFIHHNILGLPLGSTIEAVDVYFSCIIFCGVFTYTMAVGAVLSDAVQAKGLPRFLRQSARWLLPACLVLELAGVFYANSLITWVTAVLPATLLFILCFLIFSYARTEDVREWFGIQFGLPLLLGGLMLASCFFWGSSLNPFLSATEQIFPGRWPVFLAWALGYLVGEKTKAPGAVEGIINLVIRNNHGGGAS